MILCEENHRDNVINALLHTGLTADVVVANSESIDNFTHGHSRDIDSFE